MALVSINEQYLENISDAIRAKNGFSTQYRPKDMAAAITNLSTGGGGEGSSTSTNAQGGPLTVADVFNGNVGKLIDSNIKKVFSWTLCGNYDMTHAIIPNATNILSNSFKYCYSLERVEINAQQIDSRAFYDCENLTVFINRYNGYPVPFGETGNSIAANETFKGTPIEQGTGYIYVPRSMVNSYLSSDLWSGFYSQIRAIEDYPEIVN